MYLYIHLHSRPSGCIHNDVHTCTATHSFLDVLYSMDKAGINLDTGTGSDTLFQAEYDSGRIQLQ